jgi:single-stranded-DNA-specific exonuclease
VAEAQRWVLRREGFKACPPTLAGLNEVLAQVLYARRIEAPEQVQAFLATEDEAAALGDPLALDGMAEAAERLARAAQAHERVVVYGDFDADGVCATALLVTVLNAAGAAAQPYIPDRFSESYGVNTPALERLHAEGATLVVTVDCGVRSVAEAVRARELGLDLVITDHHSLAATLPPALAVVDPKRPDSAYPFAELSGVGLAYRLAEALAGALGRAPEGLALDTVLDLVALGTVSDIVPLSGENRTLVQRGLRVMRASPRPGLAALTQVAGITGAPNSQDIAFRLGPRLNAAGRLENARLAYDLLMAPEAAVALALATELDGLNTQRQRLLETQVALAHEVLGRGNGAGLLFVAGPDFHEGIVGLVASRLVEEFHRPALVMRQSEETTRGSARSIEGFHITQALDSCADLMLRHGGHARAAGFTLANESVPALRERLADYAATHLQGEMLQRKRLADALVPLNVVTREALDALAALEPVGEGNPEPALATLGVRILALRAVGEGGKHVRMEVSDGVLSVPAIAFRQGHLAGEFAAGDWVDIIYRPTLNVWQGQTSLQLVVGALRRSTARPQIVSK